MAWVSSESDDPKIDTNMVWDSFLPVATSLTKESYMGCKSGVLLHMPLGKSTWIGASRDF